MQLDRHARMRKGVRARKGEGQRERGWVRRGECEKRKARGRENDLGSGGRGASGSGPAAAAAAPALAAEPWADSLHSLVTPAPRPPTQTQTQTQGEKRRGEEKKEAGSVQCVCVRGRCVLCPRPPAAASSFLAALPLLPHPRTHHAHPRPRP
eukprot:3854852-Rhodomonas_salina.1